MEAKTKEYEFGKKNQRKKVNYFVYNNRILHQESLLKLSVTKAAGFLSLFPVFIRIMSSMLGNALYSISCSCERHAAERKEEVGNYTETFYISRGREEY